jgi:hypothetical protein
MLIALIPDKPDSREAAELSALSPIALTTPKPVSATLGNALSPSINRTGEPPNSGKPKQEGGHRLDVENSPWTLNEMTPDQMHLSFIRKNRDGVEYSKPTLRTTSAKLYTQAHAVPRQREAHHAIRRRSEDLDGLIAVKMRRATKIRMSR